MVACDTDHQHGPARHGVRKGALRLALCDHCMLWTPWIADLLDAGGWSPCSLTRDDRTLQPA